ncbi:MAG TPA: hypothetical protein VGI16_00270 [Candidatus Acidoferrum sp.]|jgi:hypothetical protein
MEEQVRRRRLWPYALGIFLGLAAGVVLFIFLRARNIDDRTREWVVQELRTRFDSEVELQSLHVTIAPLMSVTGEELTVRYHNRTDLPPMFHVKKFSFNLGVLGVLRAPRHISGIHVDTLTITIPPKGERKPPPEPKQPHAAPKVVVDQIVCTETELDILPKKAGKDPLDFDIHDLVLTSVGANKPFKFHGNLTNAKPVGEIATSGTFGPWDSDEPGDSPVSGAYKFTDADLGPFPGIAGILSSTGKYNGPLNELQVEGETDTPDFSLDKVGRPVPLHTEYSATVDGTNGDTYLHPVRATLVQSVIIAEGSVVRSTREQGHNIQLNVTTAGARIEDILNLAVNSGTPFMTGPVKIQAKLVLPPGKEKVLQKMLLDGQFGIDDAKWSSSEVREKLESLSRHGEGQPKNEDAGSSVSDLRGSFHVEKGTIHFRSLTFSVPGAAIDLQGTYEMNGGALDFTGHLRLDAKLSQTVTGAKSWLLKAVDPFFKKDGAGTLLPITITGTRDNPTLGVTVFHKTIKKQMGGDNPGKK